MANRAYGNFGIDDTASQRPRALIAAVAVAGFVALLWFGWITQDLAARLRYQDSLGSPLFVSGKRAVYAPWAVARWRQQLSTTPGASRLCHLVEQRMQCGAVFSVIAAGLVFVWSLKRGRNKIGQAHGSARLADRADVAKSDLFDPEGVVIGGYEDPKSNRLRWLRNNGFNHSLCIGPTGLGKGIALVIPTCLTWPHSLIVHDPKNENYAKSSGYRATLGPVYRLSWAEDPSVTACFNVFDFLRFGTMFEDADAQRAARAVIDHDGEQFRGRNKHFAEGGASLIAGAMVHMYWKHRAEMRPRPCLYDVLVELTQDRVQEWLTYPHDPHCAQGWVDGGKRVATHPFVRNSAEEYTNRRGDEKASILSAAVTPLSLYRDRVLRANTSCSSFTLDELMDGERPCTIYLVTSPEDPRATPLTRLFFELLIGRLTPPMTFDENSSGQHRHRMLLLLDEFPMLGRMEVFASALAWMRGWGLTAYIFAQSYSQLTKVWGKDEVLSANCEYLTALRPNCLPTAEMLSKRLGKTTGILEMPAAKMGGRPTFGQFGRELRTPDEVMLLEKPQKRNNLVQRGGQMLIYGGDRVVLGRQPLFFHDATLQQRASMRPAPSFPAGSPRPTTVAAHPETLVDEEAVHEAIAAVIGAAGVVAVDWSDPEAPGDAQRGEDPDVESSGSYEAAIRQTQ